MCEWTPSKLRKALDSRDPRRLRALIEALVHAIEAGRAILLHREPWLKGSADLKEDDVQDTLVYLLKDDARILRKYGEKPVNPPLGASAGEAEEAEEEGEEEGEHSALPMCPGVCTGGAFKRFVIGVTMRFLRKKCVRRYQQIRQIKPGVLEELVKHLASSDFDPTYFSGMKRYILVMRMDEGVKHLTPDEQELFRLRFCEQLEPDEICRRLGIEKDAYYQRLSRLIRKLRDLLNGEE